MTNPGRGRGGLVLCLCVGLVVTACSDDTTPPADTGPNPDIGTDVLTDGPPLPCDLTITRINGRAVNTVTKLVGDDDLDQSQPGIQIDVEVQGTNLDDAVDVGLSVTSHSPDYKVKPAGGTATFQSVTVASDLSVVVLQAYATGCSSSSVQVNVEPPPECVFVDPKNNASLGAAQDTIPNDNQYTYTVKLTTKNAQTGDVTLFVNGNQVGAKVQPDALNNVSFPDTVLPTASGVVLSAEVVVGTVKRTCQATINVSSDLPLCEIAGFTPAPVDVSPPVGPAKGLGVAQDSKPSTPGVETNVEVKAGSGVNQVTLLIDGVPYGTPKDPQGSSSVTFNDVPLPDGSSAITATCAVTSSGNSSQSPPATLFVDSKVPGAVSNFTCTITDNRAGDMKCTWTAVADQGPAGMEVYQVRYTVGAKLTDANWATATAAPDTVAFAAGQAQQLELKGLPLAQTYYVGIRARDFVKNESAIDDDDQGQGRLVDFKQQERQAAGTGGAWGAVVASGDFNCDGYSDVAVGSPADNGGKGRVYIYLGNANGVLPNPEKIITGTVTGGNLGAGLAALPNFDADSDGCADLAVWASHGETSAARVYVYLGRKLFFDREDVTTGLGAELVFALPSGAPGTQMLGRGLASAGDFDNDGATDLAMTLTNTASGTDSSEVLVVYGDSALQLMGSGKSPSSKTLPAAAGVRVTGGKASESFGYAMASGGLLDGDSYADLLFGASGTAGGGAAYVVKGGARAGTLPETLALSSSRVVKIAATSGDTAFGSSVAFVGNMDNQGQPEFAVADPTDAGAVYIFNFDGTAPSSAADAVVKVVHNMTGAAGDKFGRAMGCAASFAPSAGADLNGDGYADLLVSVETLGTTGVGAVFQIQGGQSLAGLSTSKAGYTFTPASGGASYGATVMLAKDINKDGYVDVVVGDPTHNSGAGRLFLYY